MSVVSTLGNAGRAFVILETTARACALKVTCIGNPRGAHIGTWSPVLHHDGGNLAAALQTIMEIRSDEALATTLDDAFPGSQLYIENEAGHFEVRLQQHGLLRPLSVAELSDGTLRYLLWSAALLTPRPPELMVLNEPETSLHPDLLPALARLILAAAVQTQIVVVSHAQTLIDVLTASRLCTHTSSVERLRGDYGRRHNAVQQAEMGMALSLGPSPVCGLVPVAFSSVKTDSPVSTNWPADLTLAPCLSTGLYLPAQSEACLASFPARHHGRGWLLCGRRSWEASTGP